MHVELVIIYIFLPQIRFLLLRNIFTINMSLSMFFNIPYKAPIEHNQQCYTLLLGWYVIEIILRYPLLKYASMWIDQWYTLFTLYLLVRHALNVSTIILYTINKGLYKILVKIKHSLATQVVKPFHYSTQGMLSIFVIKCSIYIHLVNNTHYTQNTNKIKHRTTYKK